MTKVEIEKPVVSPELAEAFEDGKKHFGNDIFEIMDLLISDGIPECQQLDNKDFTNLLAKMFVVDYEVEKAKRYVLKLPVQDDESIGYICRDSEGVTVYRWFSNYEDLSGYFYYSDGFTKAEIESNEDLNKLASVCELVEVED